MTTEDVLRVSVKYPIVQGSSVVFWWDQSEPNPFQKRNEFAFDYEDIDLDGFTLELFWEIFLGLQLRVFAAYGRPVEVTFPSPVPVATVAFWQTYHAAQNVTIMPVTTIQPYSPWEADAGPRREGLDAAVLFGGGKDSTAAACLFAEVFGSDKTLLLQYVGPLDDDPRNFKLKADRQTLLMLAPMGELLGVRTQRVFTDYQANFPKDRAGLRPHLEFYTVGSLPALLEYGVRVVSFSLAYTYYNVVRKRDGSLSYRHPRSRPETLLAQTDHYRSTLQSDIVVTNVNSILSSMGAVLLLARRYPEALQRAIPCTQVGAGLERWCHDCRKCFFTAMWALAIGKPFEDLSYDRLFAKSLYLNRVLEVAAEITKLNEYGVIDWNPVIGNTHDYHTFCAAVAMSDFDAIWPQLGPEARENVLLLRSRFGGHVFTSALDSPKAAVPMLNFPEADEIVRIVGMYLNQVDTISDVIYERDKIALSPFDPRMPTALDDLPHIISQRAKSAGGQAV